MIADNCITLVAQFITKPNTKVAKVCRQPEEIETSENSCCILAEFLL